MTMKQLERRVAALEAQMLDVRREIEERELREIERRGDAEFAAGKGIPAWIALEYLRVKHNIPLTARNKRSLIEHVAKLKVTSKR